MFYLTSFFQAYAHVFQTVTFCMRFGFMCASIYVFYGTLWGKDVQKAELELREVWGWSSTLVTEPACWVCTTTKEEFQIVLYNCGKKNQVCNMSMDLWVCVYMLAFHVSSLQYMCVGVSVNIFLSLEDSNWLWLHLKMIFFIIYWSGPQGHILY